MERAMAELDNVCLHPVVGGEGGEEEEEEDDVGRGDGRIGLRGGWGGQEGPE